MRCNRWERGEKRREEGPRTKESQAGQRWKRRQRKKQGREQTAGFLANQHADTLELVQAPVCVGRVKTNTNGLQGFPTVLRMSHEMFRH